MLANGGTILVTAQAAKNVLDNVINLNGVAIANSVSQHGGQIILSGGDAGTVSVSGKLLALGKAAGTSGGKIHITGNRVLVNAPATIDASGSIGGGEILLGGNQQGIGPLQHALETRIASGASLAADAIESGNGGTIIVWSDNYTDVGGSLSAQGGAVSGNGGFIETSSHNLLSVHGTKINLLAKNGAAGYGYSIPPTSLSQGRQRLTKGLSLPQMVLGLTHRPPTPPQRFSIQNSQAISQPLISPSPRAPSREGMPAH